MMRMKELEIDVHAATSPATNRPKLGPDERAAVKEVVNMIETKLLTLEMDPRTTACAKMLTLVTQKPGHLDSNMHSAGSDSEAESPDSTHPMHQRRRDAEDTARPGSRGHEQRPSMNGGGNNGMNGGGGGGPDNRFPSGRKTPNAPPPGGGRGVVGNKEQQQRQHVHVHANQHQPQQQEHVDVHPNHNNNKYPGGRLSPVPRNGDAQIMPHSTGVHSGRGRTTSPVMPLPPTMSEAHEYANYIADKLVGMPAMRRTQTLQVVDLLAESFACGNSVPATRLLGVISSFQTFNQPQQPHQPTTGEPW